jgi:hypothetical protein
MPKFLDDRLDVGLRLSDQLRVVLTEAERVHGHRSALDIDVLRRDISGRIR